MENNSFLTPIQCRLLQKMENISFFPIHIFSDGILLYPPSPDENTDPFLCDVTLYSSIAESELIYYDNETPDIFYATTQTFSFRCIVGPVALHTVSRSELRRYITLHHIKNARDYHITAGSTPQIIDLLSLVVHLLTGEDFDPIYSGNASPIRFTDLSGSQTDSEAQAYQIHAYQLDNAEKDIPHTPYELEMKIQDTFKSGDEAEYLSLLQQMTQYSGGNIANSTSKYKEYSAVSLITVLTRAAIVGGASSSDAYALSDTLLQKLSICRTDQEYDKIYQEAITLFFRLAKKTKDYQNQSIYIRNCKLYICHHLNKELTPEILSEHLQLSKNYLLSLFPKYEQITLMQYIQRERVTAASNMLKYSDFSIIRIANYFQFQSQSHFGVVFKKYTGMSPAAYRKQNRPANF